MQPHKTVLEKHGKPDDALPGVKGGKERLPHQPLSGMYNKSGGRVRLTFKLEQDQLWIGTKGRYQCSTLSFVSVAFWREFTSIIFVIYFRNCAYYSCSLLLVCHAERTDKIPMGSIKAVVSEPMHDHEEYHIMVSSRQV